MDMAGHLLTASVMSAPAGLVMAKILLPETERSETAAGASASVERTTHNGLDALCRSGGAIWRHWGCGPWWGDC
jgi:CNT family concentrative nucleoside transporter